MSHIKGAYMKKICFAFVLMAGMASLGEISAAEPVFAAWTVDTDNSSIHNGEIEISIGPDAAHDGGIVLKKVHQAPKGDWNLDSAQQAAFLRAPRHGPINRTRRVLLVRERDEHPRAPGES